MREREKTLPEEVLEDLLNYAEYLKRQRERIKAFESKYGSFEALKEKIFTGRHTWEEKRDLFEWEFYLYKYRESKEELHPGSGKVAQGVESSRRSGGDQETTEGAGRQTPSRATVRFTAKRCSPATDTGRSSTEWLTETPWMS